MLSSVLMDFVEAMC